MKKIIKSGDAVRTFTRRDGCTAALKKLGITPNDYAAFIWQTRDGRYAVDLNKAQLFLDSKLKTVATEVLQSKNKGKTRKHVEGAALKRPSVSSAIRALIMNGLDNAAVFASVQKSHGVADDKAHYPGWYRSQMRKQGMIPRPGGKGIAEPVKPASLRKR